MSYWLLSQSTIFRFTYDLLSLVSPADGAENSVVILKIDEATLEALPAPWPWPREYYGEMIYLLDVRERARLASIFSLLTPEILRAMTTSHKLLATLET